MEKKCHFLLPVDPCCLAFSYSNFSSENKILLPSLSKLMSSSIACNLLCFYFIAGEILINISKRQNPMYFIKFRDKFNFLSLVLKVIFSSCQKSLFLGNKLIVLEI